MKPRDLIFIAIVVFVVGGLYFLSTRAKTPKPMPPNEAHQSASTREQCLVCHKAEKLAELEKAHRHPGKWRDEKISCLQCHHSTASTNKVAWRKAQTHNPSTISPR
jgi:nitrate/TMAO reductase-like tetraheme cytochrome c subunit